MTDPLRKPEGLSWDAASVELSEIPLHATGQDALSATIAAVLPTLAANVATLRAKETLFSGKLGAAQAAYQNSDDAGSRSVGQVVGMLGQQAGQIGQSAGAPVQAIGGQTGMFGQLMQQAMPALRAGWDGGRSPADQAAGSAAPVTASGPLGSGQPQPRGDTVGSTDERAEQRQQPQHRERELLQHAEPNDRAEAGAGSAERGRAPVKPPEHQPHRDDEDLGRRL